MSEHRTCVCLRLGKGLDRLVVVGAQADGGHIDVWVALHGHQAKLLLGAVLAGSGKLDHGAQGRRLGLQGRASEK